MARARLITTNNYYRPPTASAHETSLGVQLETSCSAEAHEMQQLMTEECPKHIPQSTPTHLDTKVRRFYKNEVAFVSVARKNTQSSFGRYVSTKHKYH